MGVASGCGCNFLKLLIPTPLVSVLFCSSIPTFCSFLKCFILLRQGFINSILILKYRLHGCRAFYYHIEANLRHFSNNYIHMYNII